MNEGPASAGPSAAEAGGARLRREASYGIRVAVKLPSVVAFTVP
jgi:hypothetical protein